MTRSLTAVVAAAAMLGSGYAPGTLEIVRLARERRSREHDEIVSRRAGRQEAREAERRNAQQLERERIAKLAAGIDPTNDRPLSRQQRRQMARQAAKP